MRVGVEPFALLLYRRHRGGETVPQLAVAFGIPEDRVTMRIRAAATHLERQKVQSGLLALNEELSAR